MSANSRLDVEKGGKGKAAPYKITHVRVPLPIKALIEHKIKKFKEAVDKGELIVEGDYVYGQGTIMPDVKWNEALKAVELFIHQRNLSESMDTRNNVNLKRFKEWLEGIVHDSLG